MAAPTLVASSVVTGGTNSHVTPSLTVQAGDVVTVMAVSEGSSSGNSFNAPTTTISNGGITQLQLHGAASNCAGGAWTFTVSTGGSGTVTLTQTVGSTDQFVLAVFVERGATAATAARSSLAASTARTLAYTPSQADSSIHWLVGDWNASAVQTITPTSTSHTTSTPGPSALPQSALVSAHYTEYVATLDDQTSTASVSYGIGGTGTGPFTIIIVEVQGTAGSSGATVNAVKATASLAANAPVVTGDGSVTAVAATDSLAANAPVVSGGATVTAVAGTLSSAAVAPTATGGASVTGVAAAINAAAIPPASVGVVTQVTAVAATASLAAVAPVVAVNASVSAVAATVSLAAVAPTVSASSPGTINAVVATATVAAVAPVVSGGASVTAVKATVSTAAVAPTVALGATVSAVAATVAISAQAPSVVVPDAQIGAVAATLTAQAYAPQVSAAALVYIFRTPGFVKHYRDKEEPLIARIPIPTPYTILKVGGFYHQVMLPTDEEVEAADVAYLGGRDYVVTSTEHDALVAAGYGSYITLQVVA